MSLHFAGASVPLHRSTVRVRYLTVLASPWEARVAAISHQLEAELRPLAASAAVADVRVLGAIGVVEMAEPLEMGAAQEVLVNNGV